MYKTKDVGGGGRTPKISQDIPLCTYFLDVTHRKAAWKKPKYPSMYLFSGWYRPTRNLDFPLCIYLWRMVHYEKKPGYSSMYLFMGDGTRREDAWIFVYVFIYGGWYTPIRSLDIPLCIYLWGMVHAKKKPGYFSMYLFMNGTRAEEAWIFIYVFIFWMVPSCTWWE